MLHQLQKELDEAQKENREALSKQRDQLNEIDRFRNEQITSKTVAAQKVIDDFKSQTKKG